MSLFLYTIPQDFVVTSFQIYLHSEHKYNINYSEIVKKLCIITLLYKIKTNIFIIDNFYNQNCKINDIEKAFFLFYLKFTFLIFSYENYDIFFSIEIIENSTTRV